jgi:uncharacterized protein YecE (DUF72 family)
MSPINSTVVNLQFTSQTARRTVRKTSIGAQGWNYDDWVGGFYPAGTRASEYLDLYARVFDTVEIDSSFYAIPTEASVQSWRARAPEGFQYSLKLPREITHERRLYESGEPLKRFCERIVGLEEKLASVLIQLPPDFSPRSYDAIERFVPLLPTGISFAVEFRDRGWLADGLRDRLLDLFGRYDVTPALVESPWIPRETSFKLLDRAEQFRFAYLRWLGPKVLTDFKRVQISRDRELAEWSEFISELCRRTTVVYGYFDNYYQGHSPATCNALKRLLGQPVVEPETLITQPSLF